MREVEIDRPVTVARLAEILEMKVFQLLADLIKRAIFIAPTQIIEDSLAIELAAQHGVSLRIRDQHSTLPRTSGPPPLPLPLSRQIDFGADPDFLSPDDGI